MSHANPSDRPVPQLAIDAQTLPFESGGATVLLLDDDPLVTRNLEMLLEMESDYRVAAFNAALPALEFLRHEPVDAILSDFLMPEMSGLDFLRRARKIQPASSRMLLTGYSDKASAIRAINEVGLFQYLEKPWDNDFVVMVLRNAVERSRLLRCLGERTHSLDEIRNGLWKMLA